MTALTWALLLGPTLAVLAWRYTGRDARIMRARRRDDRRWRRQRERAGYRAQRRRP